MKTPPIQHGYILPLRIGNDIKYTTDANLYDIQSGLNCNTMSLRSMKPLVVALIKFARAHVFPMADLAEKIAENPEFIGIVEPKPLIRVKRISMEYLASRIHRPKFSTALTRDQKVRFSREALQYIPDSEFKMKWSEKRDQRRRKWLEKIRRVQSEQPQFVDLTCEPLQPVDPNQTSPSQKTQPHSITYSDSTRAF